MCNSADQCTLCDITNNYYLNSNACSLSTRTNCNLISHTGICVRCNTGYFLDGNSGDCVQVATDNVTSNCSMYNANQVCVACDGNFLLSSDACVAVTTVIENCQTYAADGSCSMCLTGYIPSNDFMTCVQTATNDSCMSYTYLSCPMCATGYFPNMNLFYTLWNADLLSSMILREMVLPPMYWNRLRYCQAVTVTNCNVLSTFNTCTECNAGYFLENGTCTIFPSNIIPNCNNYSALTTCTGCVTGFHLTSNTCTVNTAIENCATFSGTSSTTTCTQCVATHFLSGNNCVTRVNSANIDNCATTTVTADTCATCAANYLPTGDNLKCLSVISNCQTYASSTQTATVLQCSLCNAGYYLVTSGTTTSCTLGTVSNCEIYNVSDNSCTKCNNSYYLSGSTCNKHVDIANCATYDNTQAGFCSVCNTGYYNFNFQFVCNSATAVSNCSTYSTAGVCTACNTGYYLSGSSCLIIPSTQPNCITYDGTNCSVCATGWMLNSIGTNGCVQPFDYIISSTNNPCAAETTLGANQIFTWIEPETATVIRLACTTCSDYRFAVEMTNYEAICVLTSQLTLFQNYSAVTNCKRYGINYATAPRIVCMECSSGYWISNYDTLLQRSTALTCVNTCTESSTLADSNTIIPDDFFGFVNICAPVLATGNLRFTGACRRVGFSDAQRIKLEFENTILSSTLNAGVGYFCYRHGPSSSSATDAPPSEYLLYNNAASQTAPQTGTTIDTIAFSQTAPVDISANTIFSTGYDYNDTGLQPSTFNYNGISNLVGISSITGTRDSIPNATLNNCYIYQAFRRLDSDTNTSKLGVEFRSAAIAGQQFSTLFTNTATLIATNTNYYLVCLRCNPGHAVTFTAANGASTNLAVPVCSAIQNCASSSITYGGLPMFWNTIFGCHACDQSSSAERYPTVLIQVDASNVANGQYVSWGVSGVYMNNVLSPLNGFKCLEAPQKVYTRSTALATAATAADFSNLPNCGAFAYYQALTALATRTTDGALAADLVQDITGTSYPSVPSCVACRANNFPTYATMTAVNIIDTNLPHPSNWVVVACTASANCDTSMTTQFNSCGACTADTATVWYAFMDVTAANCYRANSPNCFMLSSTGFNNANTNTCLVCKAGYIMNSENICVKIEVPNQATSASFANSYFAENQKAILVNGGTAAASNFHLIKIQYMLNYFMNPYGVSACNSGYTLATASLIANNVCAISSYIVEPPTTYGSNYKANCIRYDVSTTTYVCRKCVEGFIPKSDGSECVTTISNCLRAQNANPTLCELCESNYLNANGVCQTPSIGHCATYSSTATFSSTVTVMTCSTCLSGYYLMTSGTECRFGSIRNCMTYTNGSSTDCSACDSNHVLLSLATVKYCYPIMTTLNCATFNTAVPGSNTGTGLLNCATCANTSTAAFSRATHSTSSTLANSMCMPFTAVAECTTYSQSDLNIYSNTFACTECRSGFWYNASIKQCSARTVTPTQCATYTLDADTCATCNSGHYLVSGTSCTAFPNGIYQCSIYSSASNCTQCMTGSYLSENACLNVVTTISNCAIYSGASACSTCNAGFLLSNPTTCTSATATNCLTVESLTKCLTCAAGRGLETANDVTSCVTINIANCATTTTVSPFRCLVCHDQYYPDANGVCQSVANIIPECIIYNSATSCDKCAQGSVLSVDHLSCILTKYDSYMDPNCEKTTLSETPLCSQCSFGSFFVNGTCAACPANNFASGCLNCDPTNTSRCILCRPGYYMNTSGACVAIVVVVPPVNPNTTTPAGVSILVKAFVLFLSVLLI